MSGASAENDAGRTAIFGGTFNPIHCGHLKAAHEVAKALSLSRVVFVPSAQPPHKTSDANDPLAPAEQRLHWVEVAIADEPLFEVDGLELAREGASYSIDTLRALVAQHAPTPLVFMIGHDAFIEMDTWREPEAILEMVDIAVISRPPFVAEPMDAWLPDFARALVDIAPDGRTAKNRKSDTRIEMLEIDAIDVSASQVRNHLAHDESVVGLLPEAVLPAIVASEHYKRGNNVEAVDETQRKKLTTIVEAALERNGSEPVVMDVHALTSYTDCVVVVTGNSNRQIRSIADNVSRALKDFGDRPLGIEGGSDSNWMLIDANDVIVHVFEPDSRQLFDIEGLWTDAPRVAIDLPELAAV